MTTSALLPGPNEILDIAGLKLVPISRIIPQQDQPRAEKDKDNIATIRASIRELAREGLGVYGTGYLQPILVRWAAGAFDSEGEIVRDAKVSIIGGESRYWAGVLEERTHLPVIVTDANSEAAYEQALAENLIRSNLTPLDEGRAFLYMKNKYGEGSLKLARRIYGLDNKVEYIKSRLSLINLPEHILPMVDKRIDTITAARRIKALKNVELEKELVAFMLEGHTYQELEERLRQIKGLAPNNKFERAAAKNDAENRRLLAERFSSPNTTISTRGITVAPPARPLPYSPQLSPLPDNVATALEQHQSTAKPKYREDVAIETEVAGTNNDGLFDDEYIDVPSSEVSAASLRDSLEAAKAGLTQAASLITQGQSPLPYSDTLEEIQTALERIKQSLLS